MSRDSFRSEPFPPERRFVVDSLRAGSGKPMIHGLLSLDVTEPRRVIRAHLEGTGERLSFTGFLTACVGQAVAQHPHVHAYRDWRGRLVLFDDVDVMIIVEIDVDGRKYPMPHVVRGANRRDVRSIHDEIRRIQSRQEARSFDPGADWRLRFLSSLPGFVRRFILRVASNSPLRIHRLAGTVSVTSVGMFGGGGGWGIAAPTLYNLTLVVGGATTRPGFADDGTVEPRSYLDLTVSLDHSVVDGGPAARFVATLRDLVESGAGLADATRG